MDFSDVDPDGIRVAGEYQIYTSLIDAAGNANTATTTFDIYPKDLDSSKTRLDKYDNATDLSDSHIIYSTGTAVPAFANSLDHQTYKFSIFDAYGNPVYHWNIYNF